MIFAYYKIDKKSILIMQAESLSVEIPKNGTPTTEYIESELIKRNINPLRWAIVHVSDTMFTVSVTSLKEKE